jgi:hypothetical protein
MSGTKIIFNWSDSYDSLSHTIGGNHTIVLIQYTPNLATRTYLECDGINLAMEAIIKMYDLKLKELNPSVKSITYTIDDLYNYIDSLADISALSLDPTAQKYVPHDRAWIKTKIFQHLKSSA